MPVKFSKSEGNGELYVFTNKKNLARKTDNISAMLHLDMDNLKSMDIYVICLEVTMFQLILSWRQKNCLILCISI